MYMPELCDIYCSWLTSARQESFFVVSRIWKLVCHKCSREFHIPESRLNFVSVTDQWLQENYSPDLEAMILAVEEDPLVPAC